MKIYTELEVKELLKKQREICAKIADQYRYNKLFKLIQEAPAPKLK